MAHDSKGTIIPGLLCKQLLGLIVCCCRYVHGINSTKNCTFTSSVSLYGHDDRVDGRLELSPRIEHAHALQAAPQLAFGKLIVPARHPGVLQCLVGGDSLGGVDREHPDIAVYNSIQ